MWHIIRSNSNNNNNSLRNSLSRDPNGNEGKSDICFNRYSYNNDNNAEENINNNNNNNNEYTSPFVANLNNPNKFLDIYPENKK